MVYPPSGTTFSNPDGCQQSDVVALLSSAGGYQQILAAVLAAQGEGATVDFWVSGCVMSQWGYTVPAIYGMQITGS